MRAVIQRVMKASVTIDGSIHSQIGKGLLVLLGIEDADTADDIAWLSAKIVNLRIFEDKEGVMNVSLLDDGGDTFAGQSIYAPCIHEKRQQTKLPKGKQARYRYPSL